jgi:soluble lytic murein transglycosylase-like protein
MKEKRILLKIKDISKYDDLITEVSRKYNVDSALIKAIIKAESNFNHEAVSPVGARGLMQLMPKTASSLQVDDSFHPEKNIDGGVRYLRYLLNLFDNNLPLALAAYNAGENAVARYNYNIPPYPETRNYVRRVLNYLNSYSNNK